MNKHWTEIAEFTDRPYWRCDELNCFVTLVNGKLELDIFPTWLYLRTKHDPTFVYLDAATKCKFRNSNIKGTIDAKRYREDKEYAQSFLSIQTNRH